MQFSISPLGFSGSSPHPVMRWVQKTRFGYTPGVSVADLIDPTRLADTFTKQLVSVGTTAAPSTGNVPSSEGQWELARFLEAELKRIGLQDVSIDEHAVVMGTLPTNMTEMSGKVPTVALFAHMDTSPDAPGDNVHPQVHRNYSGGGIALGHGTTITPEELAGHEGEDVITSDGSTLLGADDKAGVAEILETLRVFVANPDLPRPNIRVAFTPDEEIGTMLMFLELEKLGADAAYTVDGGSPEELEDETFTAHKVTVRFTGVEAHPGYAKDKMVNAVKMMAAFVNRLPQDGESPETTAGREGFIHPHLITNGRSGSTSLDLILRDFEEAKSLERIERIRAWAREVEAEFPGSKVEVEVEEQYRNMKDYIDAAAWGPRALEFARHGIRQTGLEPRTASIRGGTDGSKLSERGLPTPNLPAGMNGIHSKREFVTIQDMVKCTANIVHTLLAWAESLRQQPTS